MKHLLSEDDVKIPDCSGAIGRQIGYFILKKHLSQYGIQHINCHIMKS